MPPERKGWLKKRFGSRSVSPTEWLAFDFKNSTGRSQILILVLFRPFADRIARFYPLNENRTIANLYLGPFSGLRRPNGSLLPSK